MRTAFLGLWLLLSATAQAQSSAQQAFERGYDAFQRGKYEDALRSFLEVRASGAATPELGHNLGVTYYRLGRYAEAAREFRALTRAPGWAALGHYNLGLSAQRMGRADQAAEHFEQARRAAEEPKLRALAAAALERLGRPPAPARTSALISIAAGYDSNATLSPEAETVGLSDQRDLFAETNAGISHRLGGAAARGLYGHAGSYLRKYADLDVYDQVALRLGLSAERDTGHWKRGIGGYVDYIEVDGTRLQQAVTFDAYARRRLGGTRDLHGRYQFAAIDGGGVFDYLDGWQQRLTIEGGFALMRARLTLGYELELNDRTDLRQGGDFFSYSPTRHFVRAALLIPEQGGWRTEARGELRFSRYNDPHRLGGGAEVLTREDRRWGAGARLSRAIGSGWRAFLDYGYHGNDSNIDVYDYGRHQALAGVERVL